MTREYVAPAGYGHTTSIEDQIAEHYVSPAPPKRLCQWEPRPGYPACTTPLAQSNRESLCFRHAQLERTLKTIKSFTNDFEEEEQPYVSKPVSGTELRLCAVKGCYRSLSNRNTSGRCTGHFFIKAGTQMKDGSIPKPALIAPIDLDPLATPTTRLAGSEHSRIDGERTPEAPGGSGPANAEAVAKDDDQTRQEAERREGQAETQQEERTPMSEEKTNNSTGRCKTHGYLKRGMQMKDGSIPKPKKEPVIKPEPAVKECAVLNCRTPLAAHNKTGRCNDHYVIQRGMQMKDGTVPRPHTSFSRRMKETEARNAAAGAPQAIGRAPEEPRFMPISELTGSAPEYTDVVNGQVIHVSLKAPLEALDRFWARLLVEDKIRIVERELFGGW